jgi:hypothetical protein
MRAYELFETILDEAAEVPPTEYGYWLSPEGEFTVVGYQKHGPVMQALGVCKTSGWREAFEAGWVRIGSNIKEAPNMLFVEFAEGTLTARSMSAIRRLARSQDFSRFFMTAMSYAGKGSVEKNFDRTGPFLVAVQEAGRKPAAQITEAEIPTTEYGYWISPTGQFFPVHYQRHAYVIAKISNDETGVSLTNFQAMREGWIRVIADEQSISVEMYAHRGATRAISALRRLCLSGQRDKFYATIHAADRNGDIGYGKSFTAPGPFMLYMTAASKKTESDELHEGAIPPTDYGYWIDDIGGIHPVGHQSHLQFLQNYGDPLIDGYEDAFAEGWIRVVSHAGDVPTLMLQMAAGTFGSRQLSALRRIATSEEFHSFNVEIQPNYDLDMSRQHKAFSSSGSCLAFVQEFREPNVSHHIQP